MSHEVSLVIGRGNYILSSDKDRFFKAGVQEAILHTDNRMVLAVLRGENVLIHVVSGPQSSEP